MVTHTATWPSNGGQPRVLLSAANDRQMPDRPRLADRLWDAAALLFLLAGVALFAYSRRVLTSIGDGTYEMPQGVSAVSRTDLHVAQSRLGMALIVIGVLVGVAAAVRHRLKG